MVSAVVATKNTLSAGVPLIGANVTAIEKSALESTLPEFPDRRY